jgi:hypothetical protein
MKPWWQSIHREKTKLRRKVSAASKNHGGKTSAREGHHAHGGALSDVGSKVFARVATTAKHPSKSDSEKVSDFNNHTTVATPSS